jgi:hypothetical protein
MSRRLASVTVLELHVFSQRWGRAFMPYPFRFTRPIPYESDAELSAHRAEVVEGLAGGRYDALRRWFDVQLRDAEIRVEGSFTTADGTASAGISATRWQDVGFVARQDDDDVITVEQVSAYELGAEVAKLADLSGKPGAHDRVTVPDIGIHRRAATRPVDATAVVDPVAEPEPTRLAPESLLAGGEIQSAYLPAKRWGRDRSKSFIGWLRTRSGDYVVGEPYEYATPVTRSQLTERVDRLIAADVAAIRALRQG